MPAPASAPSIRSSTSRFVAALAVTPPGQDYYEATVRILQDLDSIEEKVLEGQSAPSGLVRVTLSPAFGRMFVIPRLSDFRSRFPEVAIEMEVSGRHVDLIEEGMDVAIRIGRLSDSALVARRIGDMRMITLASARTTPSMSGGRFLRASASPTMRVGCSRMRWPPARSCKSWVSMHRRPFRSTQ